MTNLKSKISNDKWKWLMALFVAICIPGAAYAIDRPLSVSMYIRDQWGAERGFPAGPVYAITQTADGYLWIGTEKGLVRFDGLNFRLIHISTPSAGPISGPVLGLVADSEGNLWIRLRSPGLLRYRDGKFENAVSGFERPESGVTAMCRGTDGKVLLSALINGALRYSDGKFITLAPMSTLPNFLVISMTETPDGNIWLGTRDAGLFRLSEGQASAITKALPDRKVNCLLPIGDRELLVGTDNGIARWNGTEFTSPGLPPAFNQVQALAMIKDHNSNVWIGAGSQGLLRFNAGGVATIDESGRGPIGAVTALFEDREGNIWVGSARGLERLRDRTFVTYPVSATSGVWGEPPSESPGAIHITSVAEKDRAWFAPSDGGLYWMKEGKIGRVTNAGLNQDVVYSISGGAGGKDELWIGRQRGGLTRLLSNGGSGGNGGNGASFVAETYTQAEGLAQNSVYAVYQSRDGSVWAGTLSGGVSRLRDGMFTTYTAANGLASNTVASIAEGVDGTMWFATPYGLSSLSKGKWRTYTSREGLPSESVNCLLEDSTGALWIGTAAGLAFLSSDRIQFLRETPEPLREQILGIAEDKLGFLWIATSNHVLRAPRDKLMRGALGAADTREFGLADGLLSVEGVKRSRSVAADQLGRIWVSTNRGLSVVDPGRLAKSSAPALVHIQTISVDGAPVDLQSPVRISADHQKITFSYAGLSLSVPERVRFRYTLDDFDPGWSEPKAATEASYTNLSPGAYRFRVIASNSDGLWNSDEAVIRFEIEPMFWQTWWFRFSIALACVFAMLAIYQLRLRHLTRRLNVRFEERLAERTRIAQDLHDTLLQGVISASMQLHVAVDRLPDDSTAKPPLGRVLQLMGQVIEEGRNAVRGLRSSHSDSLDLEQAFSRIRQEVAVPNDTSENMGFRVIVGGRPRPLRPIIRDEVYRIGREALVNAFRHSQAKNIEVEVEYVASRLRILIRDDGCGIAPQLLQSGRDGHWGLPGMRERAERIGGRLKLRSRVAAGTEVELSVPGYVAFQIRPSQKWLLKWIARLSTRKKH
jgi:signal transduction histidine kinase/ligand-binding sensor domain-containing protein